MLACVAMVQGGVRVLNVRCIYLKAKRNPTWHTQVSKVCCLHVTGLLLEDCCAATGKRVHVGRDGTNGHMAGTSRLQDGMVIPRGGVGGHWSWNTERKRLNVGVGGEPETVDLS